MDILNLLANLQSLHVAGKFTALHLILMLGGTLFPILLGIALPRSHTIHYGIWLNKILGLALLQKRLFKGNIPSNIVEGILHAIQTTFQDVSFGVYLDSRKDITPEEKEKKIEEYLSPAKKP